MATDDLHSGPIQLEEYWRRINGYELYYDRDSRPISLGRWFEIRASDFATECIVGRTRVAGCLVSTVWVGLNMGFCPGQVLIFETRILNLIKRKRNRPWSPDELTWRYRYEVQAERGHERAVNRLRARGWARLSRHWYDDDGDTS